MPASRPQEDSEQKQTARHVARETNLDSEVNTVPVIARGVSVVPGAIVCPDFPTLSSMFSLYTGSWGENFQNVLTNGRAAEIEGPPIPTPNFELYGCALLPIGTPMRQKNVGSTVPGVPVVIARLPNGKTISGVTLPSMIE